MWRKFKIKFEIYLFLNPDSEFRVLKLPSRSYRAKLLLFGEYSILEAGSAIAFPISTFSGSWSPGHLGPDAEAYLKYLTRLEFLDADRIRLFLEGGHIFNSNIPIGYGIGSSGAVTAAAYDLFAKQKADKLPILRQQLSDMESFFHGKSSGLDPLCSYLDSCILSTPDGLIIKEDIELPANLFLLDSGKSRSTSTLVDIFKGKMKDRAFSKAIGQLKSESDLAISSLIQNDLPLFARQFRTVSRLQLEWFREMILPGIAPVWEQGLESGEYTIKLSGAGGGGFYLGLGKAPDIKGVIPLS